MAQDGQHKLQVIADFDDTLTKFTVNGKRNPGSYAIIRNVMPESYRMEAQKYFTHYYPKEMDPNLSPEEKFPLMKEWITKVHELILKYGIQKSHIANAVDSSDCTLRCKCKEMIHGLNKFDVPILIFSAGIGNIIEEVLRRNSSLHPVVKIVSNFLQFNEGGNLTAFSKDKIHMSNKNENAIHDSSYFKRLAHRANVILLGDSLGDLGMAEGVQGMDNLLKIGFLSDHIDQRFSEHMNNFDIVLLRDETMNVPSGILDYILTRESSGNSF